MTRKDLCIIAPSAEVSTTLNYPLMDVFLTIFWFFAWSVWIFLVVWTLMLIFRRRDLSGWAKAAWVVFVIFVPLLGVLAYLVARGGHLADEQVSEYGAPQDEAYRAYAGLPSQHRLAVARYAVDGG